MVTALALLVRGMAFRRGIAIALVVVTAVSTGTAAAAAAAVYRQAAGDSALRARLGAVPPITAGVRLSGTASADTDPVGDLRRQLRALPDSRPAVGGLYQTGLVARAGARPTRLERLQWRQDACAHLRLAAGRCPRSRGEVLVPTVDAGTTPVGTRLTIDKFGFAQNGDSEQALGYDPVGADRDVFGHYVWVPQAGATPTSRPVPLTVVGAYRPPTGNAGYWTDSRPVPARVLPDGTVLYLPTLLTAKATFDQLPHTVLATPSLDRTVRVATLTTASVPGLLSAVARQKRVPTGVSVTSGLPRMLAADAAERSVLGSVVRIAAAQLLGLVGLVLVLVLVLAVAARRVEFAAAALAGRSFWRVAPAVLVEPVLLLAAGTAVGLAAAVPVVRLLGRIWLLAGTPVRLDRAAWTAALVVVGAGLVAAAAVAVTAARRPAERHLGEPRPVTGQATTVLETVVLFAAVAGVVELLTAGGVRADATPWALLAPALCGLAGGLLAGRLVPLALRPMTTATVGSSRLATFLTVRDLRRDHGAWRIAAAVSLSLALLSFAVTVGIGAQADRRDRAGLTIGATRVVQVDPSLPAAALLADTHRVDPHGRWAMAAVQLTPFGSRSLRSLVVDTPRLPAVAAWTRPVAGRTPAQLVRLLRPTPPAPALFRGADLRLTLDVRSLQLPSGVALQVTGRYAQPSRLRLPLPVRTVTSGDRTVSLPVDRCDRQPCRLLSLTFRTTKTSAWSADIRSRLHGPWQTGTASLSRTGGGLRIVAQMASGGPVTLTRVERPTRLPALSGGGLAAGLPGLDGLPLPAQAVADAPAVPRLLGAGSMVDLNYALLASSDVDPGGTLRQNQVWIGPHAPAGIRHRLEAAGLPVLSIRSASTENRVLGYLAPAAGLHAYLAVSVVAALVALTLLVAGAGLAARRRAAEMLVFVTAGVPRSAATRALAVAAVLRLLLAAATGLAAGLGMARLAAAGVPLAVPGTVPAPYLAVPALPAVIATAVAVVPLIGVEVIGVVWVSRRPGLRRLREVAA